MTHRIQLVAGILVAAVMTAPVAAQNRADQQVFLDIRHLQSQVQKLQLALNAATEQLKQTEGRIDAQASAAVKGFADQKVQIDAIATGLRTLNERENEGSVRVLQLTQEMKSIREGLQMQQTLLNEILKLLQPAQASLTDPASATPPGGTAPPRTGTLPASPGEYYRAAFGFFWGGEYENAISTLTEAIAKFPGFPEAARAQVTIGESHMQLRQDKEALAAFRLAIKTYKDPEAVADAYYKEAQVYERLGQKDAAKKSLDELIKLYPNSAPALMAPAMLKRMGFIK